MSEDKIEQYLKLVRETYSHSSNPIVENALRARREVDVARAGFYEVVINEPGTAEEDSPTGSWKSFWIKNGNPSGPDVNTWPTRCSVCECYRSAEHGAHVRDADGHVYIVPMCAKENNPHNTSPMLIRQGVPMVAVSKARRK